MYKNSPLMSQMIIIYSEEVYQKSEIQNLSAGADDESDSCTIPTVCAMLYPDSSIEHLMTFPANVLEREDKENIVVLLSITFFVPVSEVQYAMSLSCDLHGHPVLYLYD